MTDNRPRAIAIADLAPQTFIATEADEAGAPVRDLLLINPDRVIWVEAEAAARTLRFQVDRDSWLRVVLPTDAAYDRALARVVAVFPAAEG